MILVSLTLIMFVLQITCGKNEKLDTLASCNCTKDSLLHEFLSAALSLIMIMLQANFLLMGVFGLSPSLDKLVAVGCKKILESTIIWYSDQFQIQNIMKHLECKQVHMCNKENLKY